MWDGVASSSLVDKVEIGVAISSPLYCVANLTRKRLLIEHLRDDRSWGSDEVVGCWLQFLQEFCVAPEIATCPGQGCTRLEYQLVLAVEPLLEFADRAQPHHCRAVDAREGV